MTCGKCESMAKIINTKTGEVIYSNEYGTVCQAVSIFFERYSKTGIYIGTIVYEHLSELIETMTGDSITPFNNVGEMIKHIPDILTATEETAIIQLIEPCLFFVLPYDYEDNIDGWNKILQTIYPEYSVIDD